MQQQSMAPALFPSATQGYNPQVQQNASLLCAANLHQDQVHQHAMHPYEAVVGPNAATITITTPSSNSPEDTNTNAAPSDISNSPEANLTAGALTSSEDQAMPPSTRKRARSPSPDK